MENKELEKIRSCIASRYEGDNEKAIAVRAFLDRICSRHVELDLGDNDLADKLCSGDENKYWQQLSEILIANELLESGVKLTPSHSGPDFLIDQDGKRIWIEVICPQGTGLPAEWLAAPTSEPKVSNVPHDAILLRWTAAIKEKAEKLLGNPAKDLKGYLQKGVVKPSDAYVIAVNARLLRGPFFASILGISQFPYAVEAAFSVGPITITIDRNSLKKTGSGRAHRPYIKKPNGADVPAYTFLDPAFRPVSAIWAVDLDETWIIGNVKASAVVHNPEAQVKVPVGLLPAYDEYLATPDAEGYLLERQTGRWKE